MKTTVSIAALGLAFLLGCGPLGSRASETGEIQDTDFSSKGFRLEVVASGLDTPWAMAFAPDGRLFFTERTGVVRVVGSDGKLREEPLSKIDGSRETGGEGGLMGLALHPNFKENNWMYLSFTNTEPDDVRIVRYTVSGNSLTSPKVILSGIESGRNHVGCALAFGPDGKLYITTGEKYERDLAQDMGSLNGKTLRVNDDGTVPSDNPFVNKQGVRPEIYSFGHRNAQGIDWEPGTRRMYQVEHGPSGADGPGGGDELNRVEAGLDYGWPKVSHDETLAGTVAPVKQWTPAVAPGGCAFYTGSQFANWKGNLFFAALGGRDLIRLKIEDNKVVEEEKLLGGRLGRIRAVANGPEGYIYFSTSNRDGRGRPAETDDRIFKLVPLQK